MTFTVNPGQNIVIDSEQDIVYLSDDKQGIALLGSISTALGNVIFEIESQCPLGEHNSYLDKGYVAEHTLAPSFDERIGTIVIKNRFCFQFTKTLLTAVYAEIGEHGEYGQLSMSDIEDIRNRWKRPVFPSPLTIRESCSKPFNNGIIVRIASDDKDSEYRLKDVLFALLYFHAYNGHKLKRCIHCNRWFAVPASDKRTVYCQRNSLFNIFVRKKGVYTHIDYRNYSCHKAVNSAKSRLNSRKSVLSYSKKCDTDQILSSYIPLENNFINFPSIKNMTLCFNHLYGDPAPERYIR